MMTLTYWWIRQVWCIFALLVVLHLCLLRYFPSTNLVDHADNCYTSLYFYFSSFSMFIQSRILKLVVICSCCSFLFLLSTFFILLFSTLLSISCSVFSLFIHFIFWSPLFSFQICYPFFSLFVLLCSVCFSLMLYSHSICSLSISLHLFRSLYLIILRYLFCSCFCFLYTSSFWFYDTSCSVLLSFFLSFLFPSIFFLFFYASFLLLFLFFHFFCSLLSSLVCYSISYYWLTDFSR